MTRLNRLSLLSIISTLLATLAAAHSFAQSSLPSSPRGVEIGQASRFQVHIETTMNNSARQALPRQIRVWHALPVLTPWSRTNRLPGATSYNFEPRNGKFEAEADQRSGHIYFEENRPFQAGTVLNFKTDFEVFSAPRRFSPENLRCSFHDYKKGDFSKADKLQPVLPELQSLSQQLKSDSPITYVRNISDWLKQNIEYDDSVSFGATDTRAILRAKKGHCGHSANLFKQLCQAQGVPYRSAWGLFLADRTVLNSMGKSPESYSYYHTWNEVCFPNIGWVEVDPSRPDCFDIPANYVINNSSFQNCAVWITDASGFPHMPKWSGSSYEFDIKTKVSFQEE